MELHQDKAKHAVGTQPVVGTRPMVGTRANQTAGTAGTMPGSTVPTYPLGGQLCLDN
ncbi:hypothetical protein NC651_008512 [Populus alba x Populus x berolinensis]|nr:hypothetical protein NC651_008512 [Populus alba x Populus x berolinensis]